MKHTGMQHIAPSVVNPALPIVAPWSLRSWPPVLWQARTHSAMHFMHLGTCVTVHDDLHLRTAGQTVWGNVLSDGRAGVAWDWVQMPRGMLAMADPMCVVTNLRVVGEHGEVLTAFDAARVLNEIVYALPWQTEVHRALHDTH